MTYTDSRICINLIIAQSGLLKDKLLFYSANDYNNYYKRHTGERDGKKRAGERKIKIKRKS